MREKQTQGLQQNAAKEIKFWSYPASIKLTASQKVILLSFIFPWANLIARIPEIALFL